MIILEMPSQSLQWQSGFLGKNLVSLLSLKFTISEFAIIEVRFVQFFYQPVYQRCIS